MSGAAAYRTAGRRASGGNMLRTLAAKLLTMANTGRSRRARRCAVRLSAGRSADVTATAPKKFYRYDTQRRDSYVDTTATAQVAVPARLHCNAGASLSAVQCPSDDATWAVQVLYCGLYRNTYCSIL
jgi:hypothetical protein